MKEVYTLHLQSECVRWWVRKMQSQKLTKRRKSHQGGWDVGDGYPTSLV